MSEIEQITKDLSLRLQQAVPNPESARLMPLSEQNLQRRLDRFYLDAAAVRAREKLGIIGWARVMLGLRSRLLTAGYPPNLVSPLIRSTLFQAARPDLAVKQPAHGDSRAKDEPGHDGRADRAERDDQRQAAAMERARAQHEAGKRQQALATVKAVLKRAPHHFEALMLLGRLQAQLGQDEAAIDTLERAVAQQPGSADAHLGLGAVLMKTGELRRARDSFDAVLRIDPDNAAAHHQRAVTFFPSFEMEAGLAAATEAVRCQPESGSNHVLRGFALQSLNRLDEAFQCYVDAEKVDPDLHVARWNRGIVHLLRGEFAEGWDLYEARRKALPWPLESHFSSRVEWTGEEDLAGKRIVLSGEQGLGDVIQFSRFARLVKARGAHVVLYLDPVLEPLLKQVDGADEVVPYAATPPASSDYWVPLMSLPRIFQIRGDNVPSPGPYLKADPQKVSEWSQRLGERRRPRVGLVWSGNSLHAMDLFRNIPLETLTRHLPAGFDYFGIQKEVRQADKEWLSASGMRFLGPDLKDFGDTAAVCELMDAIVTVDTSAAHLAGALGRPVNVMLSFIPDWRWMMDREDSPWYQSVRLFRQGADRKWDPVVQKVAADLKARLG